MKAEFELNLDSNGRPCIKFRHHDKDNSLEQKALKVFLDAEKVKSKYREVFELKEDEPIAEPYLFIFSHFS